MSLHESSVPSSVHPRVSGLEPELQAVLASLSALPDTPLTLQAAMAVNGVRREKPATLAGIDEAVVGPDTGAPEISDAAVRQLETRLAALVDAGVLERDGTRWHLPAAVRALASSLPGAAEAGQRLVEGYVLWMEAHQGDHHAMLEEQPFWVRAINTAMELRLDEAFLYLAGWVAGAGGFYHRRGDLETRARVLDQAAARLTDAIDAPVAAWIRFQYGGVLRELGRLDAALDQLQRSLRLAEAAELELEAAMARGEIAGIQARIGELDEAVRLYHEKMAALQRLHAPEEFARTCGDLAEVLCVRGAFEDAVALLEQKLGLHQAMGNERAAAMTRAAIGDVLAEQDDFAGAVAHYQQALPVLDALDPLNSAAARGNLGLYQQRMGQLDAARESFEQALETFRAHHLHEQAAGVEECLRELQAAAASGTPGAPPRA